MVTAFGVVRSTTRAGFCSVDSIGVLLLTTLSALRGVGRCTGRLNAELLGVLAVQSLPAAELHDICPGDTSNHLACEQPHEYVEADVPTRSTHRYEATVDVVPEREPCAAASKR